jgi:hypothetical protein
MLRIDETRFVQLMSKVVCDKIPLEVDAFDVIGRCAARSLFETERVPTSSAKGPHEFGEGITQVLEFLSLLIGTYFSLKQLLVDVLGKVPADHPTVPAVVDVWVNKLVEAGMEKTKAEAIANAYAVELLSLISSK